MCFSSLPRPSDSGFLLYSELPQIIPLRLCSQTSYVCNQTALRGALRNTSQIHLATDFFFLCLAKQHTAQVIFRMHLALGNDGELSEPIKETQTVLNAYMYSSEVTKQGPITHLSLRVLVTEHIKKTLLLLLKPPHRGTALAPSPSGVRIPLPWGER